MHIVEANKGVKNLKNMETYTGEVYNCNIMNLNLYKTS